MRSGNVAANRTHIGPPSAPPNRAARSDPTASSTAPMSSMSSSNEPSARMRSERPVPRRSKITSRAKAANFPRNVAYPGHHWFCSRWDRYPGAKTRSIGPSPCTWYAIRRSPLFAYRVSPSIRASLTPGHARLRRTGRAGCRRRESPRVRGRAEAGATAACRSVRPERIWPSVREGQSHSPRRPRARGPKVTD